MSSALRERDLQLDVARRKAEVNERLASLSTLAAGAAHELGTPLATIAVASKELERSARVLGAGDDIASDARLIREQVERCREIVQQMGARTAGALGEVPESTDVADVIRELRGKLDEARNAHLEVHLASSTRLVVPRTGLAQALGSLVENAFDAVPEQGEPVVLTFERDALHARFVIEDRGGGMSGEDLAHVGEPFFTTKPPGSGMGLGVFLARAFAERLGGRLTIGSTLGVGTHVVLELPVKEG